MLIFSSEQTKPDFSGLPLRLKLHYCNNSPIPVFVSASVSTTSATVPSLTIFLEGKKNAAHDSIIKLAWVTKEMKRTAYLTFDTC